jgi:hypothetical protein
MKECDDPKSNKTTVGCWFTRNILAIIGSPSGTSSTVV